MINHDIRILNNQERLMESKGPRVFFGGSASSTYRGINDSVRKEGSEAR